MNCPPYSTSSTFIPWDTPSRPIWKYSACNPYTDYNFVVNGNGKCPKHKHAQYITKDGFPLPCCTTCPTCQRNAIELLSRKLKESMTDVEYKDQKLKEAVASVEEKDREMEALREENRRLLSQQVTNINTVNIQNVHQNNIVVTEDMSTSLLLTYGDVHRIFSSSENTDEFHRGIKEDIQNRPDGPTKQLILAKINQGYDGIAEVRREIVKIVGRIRDNCTAGQIKERYSSYTDDENRFLNMETGTKRKRIKIEEA